MCSDSSVCQVFIASSVNCSGLHPSPPTERMRTRRVAPTGRSRPSNETTWTSKSDTVSTVTSQSLVRAVDPIKRQMVSSSASAMKFDATIFPKGSGGNDFCASRSLARRGVESMNKGFFPKLCRHRRCAPPDAQRLRQLCRRQGRSWSRGDLPPTAIHEAALPCNKQNRNIRITRIRGASRLRLAIVAALSSILPAGRVSHPCKNEDLHSRIPSRFVDLDGGFFLSPRSASLIWRLRLRTDGQTGTM